ncbi:MAG: hypothetical protein IJA72_02150, partial [Clostridia bacterium]|nr:hypothetical protein [Clostridia bacterium]
MSKFAYRAEGELNSQYLLDLLNDYLDKAEQSNDVNGIVEDNFNINVKSNRFVRFVKDKFKRIKFAFGNSTLLENYNKVLSTEHINNIKDKIQIFLQTNVLEPKQIMLLKNTLSAINFDIVLPEIDENRCKVIGQARRRFLSSLNDVKYLKHANVEYVLFNSPVNELKPFLSDKVSTHKLNAKELAKLVKQFVNTKCEELNNFEIEEIEPQFKAKPEDFYANNITEAGIGEDVEEFIRSKMLEKLNISKQEETLIEDRLEKIAKIDALLKKLKLHKIEQMLQKWIEYQTNIAQAKEVVDKCKELINESTLTNKKTIFLVMDNLYYKLTTKCDKLQDRIKFRLQLVDKQKMFSM